jgi:DNA polymerase bacteriophage-type
MPAPAPIVAHDTVDPDRALGPTFAIENIGWIDFETRGKLDIKVGAFCYATEADAILLAFAIGNAPPQIVAVQDFLSGPLSWGDMPDAIKQHHQRVMRGEAHWAAWNATFDRAIWNYATLDFPELLPYHVIDPMAQALAAGLPGKLDGAARFSGSTHKLAGTKLIKLFCEPDARATPQSHPGEWQEFCTYALGDIEAMRSVFFHTRQLALAEWKEYWAAEVINERGINIDVPMVEAAARLAHEDQIRSRAELARITQGFVRSVDQVAQLTRWLLRELPVEGHDILLKREEEFEEDGTVKRPAKFSLTRRQVESLIVLLESEHYAGHYPDALRVLQIRLYGGSKTPVKFRRMRDQSYNGVLMGQFVFGGAGQTGRYSSKGAQLHNQSRSKLDNELDLIDAIIAGADYDTILGMGPDPVARKLSLLVRPALIPGGDSVFVWSDWSNIEARVTPWLADYDRDAAERLQIFRDIDADPSLPDVYTRTAAKVSRIPIEQVTESIRQRGKILDLSLQFGGSTGALKSMAVSNGMHLTDREAREAVDAWRDANPWAQAFGRDVMAAVDQARHVPHHYVEVGRIGFVFLPDLMRGSLLMRLPSGRFLTYRRLRYELVEDRDDDGTLLKSEWQLTCARGFGKIKLWGGIFVENATQATAADTLRGTLVRLVDEGFDVRAHVHDEVITTCPESEAKVNKLALREVMRRGFNWSEGLPLMSEETIAYAYSKNKAGYIK